MGCSNAPKTLVDSGPLWCDLYRSFAIPPKLAIRLGDRELDAHTGNEIDYTERCQAHERKGGPR